MSSEFAARRLSNEAATGAATVEAGVTGTGAAEDPSRAPVHPGWVRVTHWINAVAMVLMILSGWRIYNASPLFNFEYPEWMTIGGWLGGAIMWHLAAMWLFVLNGAAYLLLGVATGRFRRKLLPISPAAAAGDIAAAFRGRLTHENPAVYNAAQRLLYAGVIVAGLLVSLSGLSIWKPVQFQELTALFGGFDAARYVHFAAMVLIVAFLLVHVVMAFLIPRSLRAMIIGR